MEEDGEIISHQYRMQIAQRSMVYLTIKPLNLSQAEGKFIFSVFKKNINLCLLWKYLCKYLMVLVSEESDLPKKHVV